MKKSISFLLVCLSVLVLSSFASAPTDGINEQQAGYAAYLNWDNGDIAKGSITFPTSPELQNIRMSSHAWIVNAYFSNNVLKIEIDKDAWIEAGRPNEIWGYAYSGYTPVHSFTIYIYND